MNELQNFNFKNSQLQTIVIDDKPWFVGNQVAETLGYSNPSKAINDHVKLHQKQTLSYKAYNESLEALWTGRDYSDKVLISEGGLNRLVMRSSLDSAEEFQDWVTDEVLPTIRKHGAYNAKVPTTQRELVQLALSANEETNQRIDVIENKIHDIEENKLITTEDKGTIDSHVRKKVYQICKDLRLSQEAKSMLFKDLGSSIKQLFNVPNRGRIKDKDFVSALEFVESWEPSSVTKAKINQLSLFDRGIAG